MAFQGRQGSVALRCCGVAFVAGLVVSLPRPQKHRGSNQLPQYVRSFGLKTVDTLEGLFFVFELVVEGILGLVASCPKPLTPSQVFFPSAEVLCPSEVFFSRIRLCLKGFLSEQVKAIG